MENLFPAPWSLSGKGYILLYNFNKTFVESLKDLPSFLKGSFTGGIGSIMLVDYSASNAGPYSELLFIPGSFLHHGKKLKTISKIYVSTIESVVNGRRNWGIPKEQANFTFRNSDDGKTEQIHVSSGNNTIADFTIQAGRIPFPVSTKLLPFPLVQSHEGHYYYTSFSGNGTGKLAKVKDIRMSPELFPDVSGIRPLAAVKVDPFKITFPIPRIEPCE